MSGVMDACREEKGAVVESLRVGEREGRDEEEEGKWGGVCRGGGTEGKSVPCTVRVVARSGNRLLHTPRSLAIITVSIQK